MHANPRHRVFSPGILLKKVGSGVINLKELFTAAKEHLKIGGTITNKGLLSLGGFVAGAQLYKAGLENDRVLGLVTKIENNENFEDSNSIIIITNVKTVTSGIRATNGATTVKSYYSRDSGTFLGEYIINNQLAKK